MKLKHLAFFTILLALFASCTVKPEKAKDIFTETANNIVEQYSSMLNSQSSATGISLIYHVFSSNGVDTIQKSSPISNFEILSKLNYTTQFADYIIDNFVKKPVNSAQLKFDDCNFTISDVAGTYEYNVTDTIWNYYPGNPADQIVVKFPADTNGTTNNAVLTITQLTVSDCNPTNLVFTLEVDGNKILEFTFEASYNSSGDPVMVKITGDFEGTKIDYYHNYTETDYHIVVTANISKGLTTYEDVNADIYLTEYNNDIYPDHGEFTVRAFDLKAVVSFDFQGVNWDEVDNTYTDEQLVDFLNEHVIITFKTKSGRHIGDGVWAIRTDGTSSYIDLKIVYSDESYDWFSDWVEDLGNRLQQETEDFINSL